MKNISEIKSPKIDFIGGLSIESKDPEKLSIWYHEKFGFELSLQHEGGFYGGFKAEGTELHFGIMKWNGVDDPKSNMIITFHVDDFEAYLSKLIGNGLVPQQKVEDSEGKFAFFKDCDGNRIGIWGQ